MGLKTVTYPSHINNEFWEKLDEVLEAVKDKVLKKEFRQLNQNQTQTASQGPIGFTCKISKRKLAEIYDFMTAEKYIQTSKENFDKIFNSRPTKAQEPVIWLIKSRRGKMAGRGNKIALFIFLELMLGKLSNVDLKKATRLFVDKKGPFISDILKRPPKDSINFYGFEDTIKSILNL